MARRQPDNLPLRRPPEYHRGLPDPIDFYLPEYGVYIEYWGTDTPRYKAGKKLISLYPDDTALRDKLARISRADVAESNGRSESP